jgi:hypothetical protein
MFRWTSTQPLPEELEERLDHAGAVRDSWFNRESGCVLVFLPPHRLISAGRLPYSAILASYQLTLDAAGIHQATAVNGERLLHCSAEQLADWDGVSPLPASGPLAAPQPLEGAMTSLFLQADAEFADLYYKLELISNRGGCEPDQDYPARLGAPSAAILLESWNQRLRMGIGSDKESRQLRQTDLDREREMIHRHMNAESQRIKELRSKLSISLSQWRALADLATKYQALLGRMARDGGSSPIDQMNED